MLPASFHDQTIYGEVSAARWRAVLDAAGEPGRLSGEVITPARLLKSLMDEPPGKHLLEALEIIVELGTENGREQFQQAAGDAQVPLGAVDEVPARELSARIWVDSHTNTKLAIVLVRVRAHSREVAQARPCREFAGKRPVPSTIDKEKLAESISKWCQENKRNEAVTVFAYQRGAEWWYEIFRGDPLKRVVEIQSDGRPGILHYRPAASDLLRYDPTTGRLAIATRSTRLLQVYRQLVGTFLENDTDFFASENICTLKPLQERGRDLFQNLPPDILRVDVVELRWRRGDRDKILLQGRDCFRIVEEFGIRHAEGELIEAKLSIAFAGAGRTGSVSIKVPNRIDINAGAHEPIVERMLDEVRIRGLFDEGATPPTIWSLYPWRERASIWRRCIGIDFDALFKQSALRSVGLLSVTPPDHPAAHGALTVTSAGISMLVGVSDDPAIGVRTLTASDVEGYELDVWRVVQKMQSDLLLESAGKEVDAGVWFLGTRVLSDSVTLCVFLVLRQPACNTEKLVRGIAHGAHAVLIIPQGCECALDLPYVSSRLHGEDYGELLPRMVIQLGLQDELPPNIWGQEDLILDEGRGQAWYKDVQLTKLPANSHPFRFVVVLARAKGKLVSTSALNSTLSYGRNDGATAKTAKSDLIKAIRASYKVIERDCPDEVANIVVSSSGGYRLDASALVLPLVPVASRWPGETLAGAS